VNGIAVYMKGGGDSREGKARLRQGMSEFLRSLRESAGHKRLSWKIVACGSRNEAHGAFLHATMTAPEIFNVLLVDSEGPAAQSPRARLQQHDGWALTGIGEDRIHLMIQVMEAWIVSDAESMARYYGQHFLRNALPRSRSLEGVEKERIYEALKRATAKTKKGAYHKISRAAALLEIIDPPVVRRRCPACDRLFAKLTDAIGAA